MNPKISGFTIVRHGELFDYPYLESIQSLLPIVDELIVNVGHGEDATLSQIQKLAKQHSKIKIFESDWQLECEEKKKGGMILSEQTNLALEHCAHDLCLYLQADEILHEADYPRLRASFQLLSERLDIEGLLFPYRHFYGSFDVLQTSRSAYRREVRLIRRSSGALSVGDAQSFRKKDGSKIRVVLGEARIFHYGWVRSPEKMREKTFHFDQLYHGSRTEGDPSHSLPHTGLNYQYKRILGLRTFSETHPLCMKERIAKKSWNWDFKHSPLVLTRQDFSKWILDTLERWTGHRFFEYRSYKLIK